jgi:hypothetical protein
MPLKAFCAARNKRGKPCRAAATESGLCYIHSYAGRAAEMGREGGKGNRHFVPRELPPLPPLDTSENLRKAMEMIISEAYEGNQSAKNMLAFSPLFSVLGRVIKNAELEERLEKLETMVRGKLGPEQAEVKVATASG